MPIFWLAASQNPYFDWQRGAIVFLILHLLLYPASNGYNSLHDRDTGPIGGMAKPPLPNGWLWFFVIVFDCLALGLAWLVDLVFFNFVVLYMLASKAYSWPRIRLKADPILGTAVVVLVQGAFTYYMALTGQGICSCQLLNWHHIGIALASSLTLLGTYPLTQVYQHEADAERGDLTLSMKLGLLGTFRWAQVFLGIGGLLMSVLMYLEVGKEAVAIMVVGQLPATMHLQRWQSAVKQDPAAANHANTMSMNKLASIGFSLSLMLIWWGRLKGWF